MGLDFKKAAPAPVEAAVEGTSTETVEKVEAEVLGTDLPVEKYDIVADREQMNRELVGSAEVDALVSTIQIDDMESIVSFGAETAEEISKVSDVVLRSMNMSQLDETSKMMNALAKIMSEFDIEEIKENPSLFNKIFGNMRKQLDKILAKYNTMGDQVDKIYVELKKYETEIKNANRNLSKMFDANVNYYHDLVKYILAGEQGCKEIEDYIAKREQDMQTTGDNSIEFELQNLRQCLQMLEQRKLMKAANDSIKARD